MSTYPYGPDKFLYAVFHVTTFEREAKVEQSKSFRQICSRILGGILFAPIASADAFLIRAAIFIRYFGGFILYGVLTTIPRLGHSEAWFGWFIWAVEFLVFTFWYLTIDFRERRNLGGAKNDLERNTVQHRRHKRLRFARKVWLFEACWFLYLLLRSQLVNLVLI